jgi:signal peptidase I
MENNEPKGPVLRSAPAASEGEAGLSAAGIDITGDSALRWYVEWVRSHLEIFLVAFVMAMMIRCFCIEVFKIPSGSMEPTLHGDYSDGDRILANKYILYFKQPERFDVILFKYPLNKATNFIKRVVGLPDEEIVIHNGDIYYRPLTADGKPDEQGKFAIARKELDVQQALWIPVFEWGNTPAAAGQDQLKESWELLPYQEKFDIRDGKLALKNSELRFKGNIRDYYKDGFRGGRNVVPDVKLSARFQINTQDKTGPGRDGQVRPEEELTVPIEGEIRVNLNTPAGKFIFRLQVRPEGKLTVPTEGSVKQPSSVVEYKQTVPEISQSFTLDKVIIQDNKNHLLECLSFDGTIYIILDNKVVFSHNHITNLQETGDSGSFFDNEVAIEAQNSEVLFWELKVGRDIYYSDEYESETKSVIREDIPFAIPAGKYVIMGDNVPNSKDSRFWKLRRIILKNGKTIECDADYFEKNTSDGIYEINRKEQENRGGDMWGVAHKIKIEDVADIQDEYVKFIDINDIFGRGVLVYWPPKRIKIVR